MAALIYRLALDLGTTSIGWAVLRLDKSNNPYAVVKAGVRIFSDGRVPKTGASLAVERREARQLRRRRDRLIKRQQRMLKALTDMGFMPVNQEDRKTLERSNPYELRALALDEKISKHEFGRIVMHLCKRRGFKSNRKADKKDSELGALKTAIRDMQEALDTCGFRTLGEWLNQRQIDGLSVRARLRGNTVKTKRYDYYADRSMIEMEFDCLWRAQKHFDEQQYLDSDFDELKDILLFQRELHPVKPGRCTLYSEESRGLIALPSTQQFRVLQELNNLRILDERLESSLLTLDQRNLLLSELSVRKNFTFKAMLKILKLPPGFKFNLASEKRDGLKGNLTSLIMSKKENFGPKWLELPFKEQDNIVNLLLSEASEEKLVKKLIEITKLGETQALHMARESLPQGYGSLSSKAIQKILPHLNSNVITYDKAVLLAGFDSHSQLTEIEKTGELLTKLPYYGVPLQRHVAFAKDKPSNEEERYGKIANPSVHIGLNQIRVVVNAIIKKYGLPAQINVEVTRELKLGKKKRDEISKNQSLNQKRNAGYVSEACEVLGLDPDNLDRSKRRALSQKMQLWRELNPADISDRRCPFSGIQISIEKLLSSQTEIEHILPYSRTLDDSMMNKTLATRAANRLKTNKTPWEAFGKKEVSGFNYQEILQRAAKMPDAKGRRFSESALDDWLGENDFVARSLNDTAYLSRIARAYLSCICPSAHIQAIPGRLTSMIRGKLGLNSLISNNGQKNRYDHRHHAIDALVIGITDRSFLAAIAKANSETRKQFVGKLISEMPLPWSTFRAHALRSIDQINVSHRPDHGYQGKMMEDTSWGIVGDGVVQRRVWNDDKTESVVKEEKLNVITISEQHSSRHGETKDGKPKPYKGYVGGSNYCLEVWNDDNKWRGTTVSTYEAYSVIRKLGEKLGWERLRHPHLSQNDKQLVVRVMRNDCLKLLVGPVSRIYKVQKIYSDGRVILVEIHESNVDARHRDKQDLYKMISKTAGSLQQAKAVPVSISPMGDVVKVRTTLAT